MNTKKCIGIICLTLISMAGYAQIKTKPLNEIPERTKAQIIDEKQKSIKTLDSLKTVNTSLTTVTDAQNVTKTPNSTLLYMEEKKNIEEWAKLNYRLQDLRKLIANLDPNQMVTPENYNQIIRNRFRTLSGTEIKNGKFMGQSASVDAKSLTVNLSFKPTKKEFYLLPTLTGASKDGLVDVISGSKYNKTLTGGLNFVALPPINKSEFTGPAKRDLLNNLKKKAFEYYNISREKDFNFLNDALNRVRDAVNGKNAIFIYNSYHNLIDINEDKKTLGTKLSELKTYSEDTDTLMKAKILPELFNKLGPKAQKLILDKNKYGKDFDNAIKYYNQKKFLDEADRLQIQTAKYTKQNIIWFAGGVKYNVSKYNILDPTGAGLKTDFADEFWFSSASLT
jgi:hypothetical protein